MSADQLIVAGVVRESRREQVRRGASAPARWLKAEASLDSLTPQPRAPAIWFSPSAPLHWFACGRVSALFLPALAEAKWETIDYFSKRAS